MVAYVDLSRDHDALVRIVVSLALAKADDKIVVTALTGGVSSGIYRIDVPGGSYCLKQALPKLKVAKDWVVPVERVFAEIDWLRTVGAIVPQHVPKVLGQHDAAKCFVMEFLGAEFRNWKAQLLAGNIALDTARGVGDVLGQIHSATADDAVLARRFAHDANFYSIRLEPYLVEAARVHPAVAGVLLGLVERTAHTKRVLVHGDVSPKNILLGPQGPVLLDAECAWFGDPAFDVAFCANHFLLKAAHMPSRAADLLACLAAFWSAYAAHMQWERHDVLEARVASLLPGLALARIDGKSPVEYLDEATRAVVRETAMDLVQRESATLAVVADHWMKEVCQ